MEARLTVLDERNIWWRPMMAAAEARGYETQHITRGWQAIGDGLGFIRPHADPKILEENHNDYEFMHDNLVMVQDRAQMEVYEDKSAQFLRWHEWMPLTVRFEQREKAEQFVLQYDGVLVSKADVGASSYNVRVLATQAEQLNHVQAIFSKGIPVNHCADGPGRTVTSTQRNYVLFQEYIPHDITWRVNVVGRARAIFKRYNAPGTLTAQTGNVDGVVELDDRLEALLHFADQVFESIRSKWCALDILQRADGTFRMIETSLAWPWPSPGNCMEARFFGPTSRRWAGMWELMLDEYEAGVWS